MSEKYNGWTNYETWNVKLWLDNEQDVQQYMLDLARGSKECNDDPFELSEAIEQYVTDELPELIGFDIESVPMMYGDMLNASLRSVNWYEIAEAYWNDVELS